MKRVVLVGLLCAMPAILSAQPITTETFARAGGWSAFGGRNNAGVPTCGIDARHDPSGRHFLMQWFENSNVLHVRMIRQTWAIPEGTRIRVQIRIDGNPPWGAEAFGGGNEVRWIIGTANNAMDRFEAEFRRGINMQIAFLTGNEPAWNFSLIGTNAIMNSFASCLNAASAVRRPMPPTQPFSSPPQAPARLPSQPFGERQI